MTGPERPVYRVTVNNVSQGWVETIEHRETPDLPLTRILIDDFTLTWGLDGEAVPGKLAPESAAFKLYAKNVAAVPALEAGDLLLIDLDRPTDDDPIPYMHFVGRAADPTATTVPGVGIRIDVTAAGIDADLSDDIDLGNDTSVVYTGTEGLVANLVSRYSGAGGKTGYMGAAHNPAIYTRGTRPFGQMTAQDAVDRCIAGSVSVDGTSLAVLRYAYHWLPWTGPAEIPGWNVVYGLNRDITFYLQPWLLDFPDPLELTTSGRKVIIGPSSDLDKITTLSATLVTTPTEWKRSRADIVNVVNVTASAVSGTTLVEQKVTTRNEASVARYGPVSRDIVTFSGTSGAPAVADAYLNSFPSQITWSVDALDVLPKAMDDDELDQLAGMFYPHAMPVESVAGRFLILTDISEDIAIAGQSVAMQITGCTFKIAGGELTITPSLHAVPQPEFGTSITFDDLAGGSLSDTTFTDTGVGHYIDPALDIDELAYSDA